MGDGCWRWDGPGGVRERLKKLEKVHATPAKPKYVGDEAFEEHSRTGTIDLNYGEFVREDDNLTAGFAAANEYGVSFLNFAPKNMYTDSSLRFLSTEMSTQGIRSGLD